MFKVGQRHLKDKFITSGASVVDQNGHWPKFLVRLRKESVHIFFLTHIGLNRNAAPSHCLYTCFCFLCRRCVTAIINNDIGTRFCQALCRCPAYALTTACYQCYPAFQWQLLSFRHTNDLLRVSFRLSPSPLSV